VNERIKAGSWADPGEPLTLRCECAALRCNELVEMTVREYEHVRSDPRWFLLIPGHELAGFEVVVFRGEGYNIVEKTGDAGEQAETEAPPGRDT
jgi:hypothetical protein